MSAMFRSLSAPSRVAVLESRRCRRVASLSLGIVLVCSRLSVQKIGSDEENQMPKHEYEEEEEIIDD